MKKINENIDKNIYNEKSLYLLSIRELRVMGRKLGVPSPTTLNKQDLVDYILKIVYGNIEIPKPNTSGRPSNDEYNVNDCIEKIKNKSKSSTEFITAKLDLDSILKVASPDENGMSSEVEQKIFVEDGGKFFLRNHGFISSKDDLSVLPQIVNKFSLENFDVVEIVRSGNSFKILTVNGEEVKQSQNNVKPQRQRRGQKQVFHLCTKEEIIKEIKELENKCEQNNQRLVIFSTNKFEGKNTSLVLVSEKEKNSQIYKKFVSFTNICEKLVFENEDFIVATDCSDLIEKTIDSFNEDISNRIKSHLQKQTEQLFELGNDLYVYKLDTYSTYQ